MTHLPSEDERPSGAAGPSRVALADGGRDEADSPADADADGTGDRDDGDDGDDEFAERLAHARGLLTEDATACYVGVVRDGREVDSTFAQRAGDAQQEGMQALSLLASHLRLVADEAGVDYETVAGDAVTLAERLDESP